MKSMERGKERIMKKLCIVTLLLLAMLCGCSKQFTIENPVKVTIQRADDIVEIEDTGTVASLTEQITSMEFQRGKSSKDMDGWEYWLRWYDEDGRVIFDCCVAPGSINYNGRFWICENGTIDTAYYDKLLDD
jgi:uncharacterized protein YcfL